MEDGRWTTSECIDVSYFERGSSMHEICDNQFGQHVTHNGRTPHGYGH